MVISINQVFYQQQTALKTIFLFIYLDEAFVVTSNRNHRKIHLLNIIEILSKFKLFKHHKIGYLDQLYLQHTKIVLNVF